MRSFIRSNQKQETALLCRVIVCFPLLCLLCFIFHLLCRRYKLADVAGFLSVGGALGFLTSYQVLLCNVSEDHQSLVHSALLAYSKVIAKKRDEFLFITLYYCKYTCVTKCWFAMVIPFWQ